MPVAALIMAGGQGSRLGYVDKAFVQLGGRPLIDHVLARLAPRVEKIAISANGDPSRFSAYPFPVLPDGDYAGIGPLAGLAAGLGWAAAQGAESLLTLPVDTPFIPRNLAARLTPAPAVAVYQGRQHHLIAHWRTADLPRLKTFLPQGTPYKVRDFLKICAAAQVDFAALSDPFLNINTAADLAAAESRLQGAP